MIMRQPALEPAAARAIGDTSAFRDWRHPLWLASLVVASVVFSLGLACAVPLAAFAAAAALSLSRRDALLLILLVWLANQLIGFAWLDYPWTASTFAWGVTLGIVAVFATVAGQWMATLFAHAGRSVRFAVTFLIAFVVYEAALFAVSATLLGGTEIYTMAIQGRIFAINAAAFVGLLVMSRLAVSVRLVANRSIALPITSRPA
jgi:hypothetical protein